MRKQYTAAFKAKLVLELLTETKSLSQLAAEHKVRWVVNNGRHVRFMPRLFAA